MAVVLAEERTCTAASMSDGLTMGQRIRMVRKLRKMSMDALARETGMSKNQVVQIETGVSKQLRPDTLRRYSEALGVSPEYILTGLSPPEEEEAPLEVSILYRELDEPMKRAFLQIGHSLREAQSGYVAEEVDTSRMAAFDEQDVERHVAEEGEPWPE